MQTGTQYFCSGTVRVHMSNELLDDGNASSPEHTLSNKVIDEMRGHELVTVYPSSGYMRLQRTILPTLIYLLISHNIIKIV